MKEPNRRGDGLRLLSDMSLNEVYPFLFELMRKNVTDSNPFVRRVALVGLLKLKDLTDFKV